VQLLSPLSPSPFLASSLSFTLVYLWSRLNPSIRLSLFGVLTITAPHLPYALVVFSWALSSTWAGVVGDCLGIAVGTLVRIKSCLSSSQLNSRSERQGHFWYFFAHVWKEERASGHKNWLETPAILFVIFSFPYSLQTRRLMMDIPDAVWSTDRYRRPTRPQTRLSGDSWIVWYRGLVTSGVIASGQNKMALLSLNRNMCFTLAWSVGRHV
jgi:hypothetical protein